MAVKAMRVMKAEKHPGADRLRVYEFQDETGFFLQIVANLQNVYEVGDIAAVAQVGTVLTDDGKESTIAEATLRGVPSYGMALGKVDDAVGSILNERFNAK